MTSHPVILSRLAQWRASRAEYQVYLESQVQRAEQDCNAVLLNARGKALGIDPHSLFLGTAARAHAYASEELREWWARHGRMTFQDWEAQHGHTPGRHWGLLIRQGDTAPWSPLEDW